MSESGQSENIPDVLQRVASNLGGKIEEVGRLPDDSGFAVISMPLPADHWSTQDDGKFEPPPMPFRMGTHERIIVAMNDGRLRDFSESLSREQCADRIRAAGRYAYRAATMKGKETDLDPDALIQNLVVGLLGYWTDTGLSEDPWANPQQERSKS